MVLMASRIYPGISFQISTPRGAMAENRSGKRNILQIEAERREYASYLPPKGSLLGLDEGKPRQDKTMQEKSAEGQKQHRITESCSVNRIELSIPLRCVCVLDFKT